MASLLTARPGQVGGINRRQGVDRGPDVMDSVATGAVGRRFISQAGRDPVEALDETLDSIRGNAVFLHDLRPGVTGRTCAWNLPRRSGGAFFLGRTDLVLSMAVDAEGSIDIPLQGFLSMDAFLVLVKDEDMTFPACFGPFGHEMGFAHSLNIVDAVTVRAHGRDG